MAKQILIVDDEPNVVMPIQFLMEQQGYRIMIAERGEDALDLVYRHKPDLVLLDIMLPGIDGYEVCEIIRLNPNFRNVLHWSNRLNSN
jgi:CheY-like chemotaxis protein